MTTIDKDYWAAQAIKHERMAATLRNKYAVTRETRWLRQAETNEMRAKKIHAAINEARDIRRRD